LVTVAIGLASVFIFLAHATEATIGA